MSKWNQVKQKISSLNNSVLRILSQIIHQAHFEKKNDFDYYLYLSIIF